MKKNLKPYVAFCDAIGKLFYPNVEVVMHDLETKRLVHIVNAFSKRRIGDAMLLSDVTKELRSLKEDWVGPYDKRNVDGKRLKAVSIIVRDENEEPIGMVCINFNTEVVLSLFESLKGLLHVSQESSKPSVLFSQNLMEHTDETIDQYLSMHNIAIAGLNGNDKKELVFFLEKEGIFSIRNAVPYVCTTIGVSKATLYNWLKAIREEEK